VDARVFQLAFGHGNCAWRCCVGVCLSRAGARRFWVTGASSWFGLCFSPLFWDSLPAPLDRTATRVSAGPEPSAGELQHRPISFRWFRVAPSQSSGFSTSIFLQVTLTRPTEPRCHRRLERRWSNCLPVAGARVGVLRQYLWVKLKGEVAQVCVSQPPSCWHCNVFAGSVSQPHFWSYCLCLSVCFLLYHCGLES